LLAISRSSFAFFGHRELINQAETVWLSLRDALSKTNELIKGLKSQRRLSRNVESTLASLRQLQTLEV
jgi:hypothetical protein